MYREDFIKLDNFMNTKFRVKMNFIKADKCHNSGHWFHNSGQHQKQTSKDQINNKVNVWPSKLAHSTRWSIGD